MSIAATVLAGRRVLPPRSCDAPLGPLPFGHEPFVGIDIEGRKFIMLMDGS